MTILTFSSCVTLAARAGLIVVQIHIASAILGKRLGSTAYQPMVSKNESFSCGLLERYFSTFLALCRAHANTRCPGSQFRLSPISGVGSYWRALKHRCASEFPSPLIVHVSTCSRLLHSFIPSLGGHFLLTFDLVGRMQLSKRLSRTQLQLCACEKMGLASG